MSQRRLSVLCIAVAVLLPATALACLWDYDTLQMERSRFPSALELITGKFLRHTPEFYEWRISDRLRKLKNEPDNLAYYDDLAVAYEKTSQHDKAIETIQIKDKKKKAGVYETESNFGTFLILNGKLDEGLKHIDEALRINPDAHFGREKYQKRLVEYAISRRKEGAVPVPLASELETGFDDFLAGFKPDAPVRLNEPERRAAVKGVLGMMRFANYNSPLLLEALGDLLKPRSSQPENDEKQLAARAYLKASYAVDGKAREAFRAKAAMALTFQTKSGEGSSNLRLDEMEKSFHGELAQADEWFAELRNNELTWIKEGKDPEQEFARLYYDEPQVAADPSEELPVAPQHVAEWRRVRIAFGVVTSGLLVLIAMKIYQALRAKGTRAAASAAKLSSPEETENLASP